MIDSHCHLTHRRFAREVEQVIERTREAGVRAAVTIGTGCDDGERCRELAQRFPGFVHATAGIDPFTSHRLGERFDEQLTRLRELLAGGGFCALGEVGLDYHYDLDPRPVQAERFERQLELAAELNLPVVIHVREAHADMAAILRAHPANRGVIHSFTGDSAEAEAYLALGWYLALNGVLTFGASADALRVVARTAPLERLLVETDSPYLAPEPLRGKRCEPAYLRHTLERLAQVRRDDVEKLAAVTAENAANLFTLTGGQTGVSGTGT